MIGASEFDCANEDFQNLPNVKINLLELNRLLIEVVGIDKNQIRMMLDRDNSNDITSEISEILDIVPKVICRMGKQAVRSWYSFQMLQPACPSTELPKFWNKLGFKMVGKQNLEGFELTVTFDLI